MHAFALFAGALISGAAAQNTAHLDCQPNPDAQCNVDKYCTYTSNNNNCQTQWTDDEVPTFNECVIADSCGDNHVCHEGLCCNLTNLPNGEADCPSVQEITDCCFQHTPGTGGLGLYQPPDQDRPAELSCGC